MPYADAGSLSSTAYDLGLLTLGVGAPTITGTVGSADPADVFQVTLTADADLQVALAGLAAGRDVDIRVTDTTGFNVFGISTRPGNSSDTFTIAALTAGVYYIHVAPFDGVTPTTGLDYTYTLDVVAQSPGGSRIGFDFTAFTGAPGYSEGTTVSAGAFPHVVTLKRSGNTGAAATVEWKLGLPAVGTNNRADAADFASATAGTATFLAGATDAVFTIWTRGDAIPEGNEYFNIQLSNASAGSVVDLSSGYFYGTLFNDDGANPSVSASVVAVDTAGVPTRAYSSTVVEGNSGTTDLRFAITLSAPLGAAQAIGWRVNSSDATKEDFAGGAIPSGTVTFAAGQTLQYLTVRVAGDTTVEGDQSFSIEIVNPNSPQVVAEGGYVQGIIRDDDDDFANSIAGATFAISQGGAMVGRINSSSDVDVFKVDLYGGVGVHFAVQPMEVSPSGSSGGAVDPRLELLDSAGNVLAVNDNGGGGLTSRIGFVPPANGTYYLRISGVGGSFGEYVLSSRSA
ncbi:MAG TPA: pre-peptidase C-terminal domain-containing protein, partial [Rhodocyclaceae bacterium]|nr:pre-peptidase C-terminal domain-containing protein [Rhodocyclaceae bacterium]